MSGRWRVGVPAGKSVRNAPAAAAPSASRARSCGSLFQPAAQGALPTLYAATAPDAKGGGYYGPDRLSETRGYPTEAAIPPHALGTATAARLWDVSQQLTGVMFQVTRSRIHPAVLLDPRFSLSWE